MTAVNPRPVTLKMEKVYQPCILQTKKRYVGFAYETADQEEPVFDAKGIETIRCVGVCGALRRLSVLFWCVAWCVCCAVRYRWLMEHH